MTGQSNRLDLIVARGADLVSRNEKANVHFVPLAGLGWRCDFCGEMAGQERAPAPERCPRCSGSHFTSMAAWRERCRMGLSLDGSSALPSTG